MPGHLRRTRARLALPAHRKIRGLLEGQYASTSSGRGLDFDDLRPYARGDDVADLDWKASARSGEMLVKRFVTERRHTVLLVVSTGASMAAAHSPDTEKREVAAGVAGLVGWLASRQGDDVGLVFGDASGCHGRPARGGELHLERCLDAAHEATRPEAAASDVTALLRHVARTVRRRTILLLVCDVMDADDDFEKALRRLAVQHELLVVTVDDVDPVMLPASGRPAHDLLSRRRLPTWLRGDHQLQQELQEARHARRERLVDAVTRVGGTHEHVAAEDDILGAVLSLLTRSRRARRR